MEMLQGILLESWHLLSQMAPYLLFGFFFAGVLHAVISLDWIARHLGPSSIGSVFKAVVLGIPLPLCSCGVIPAAIMLNKKGASRGSVTSFLIATPITGIDSILATYSLLGVFLTFFRVLSSAVTALIAGLLGNWLLRHEQKPLVMEDVVLQEPEHCHACGHEDHATGERERCAHPQWWRWGRMAELFRYAFVELFGDVWKWLLLGLLIAGMISYFVPTAFIERYLGSEIWSMFAMLLIGIPMYVCSTGSLPIAAALMLKGMSPGAAMVFLLAGPATNAVTITVVSRELGKGATIIYVVTIAVMSMLFGLLVNVLWYGQGMTLEVMHHGKEMLPAWIQIGSAVILLGLVAMLLVRKLWGKAHAGH